MKYLKIILSVLSLFACTASFSQTAATMTASKSTLTNADTSYSVKQLSTTTDKITIQAIVVKTSGTPAGNVLPQGSLNGTDYVNLSTDTLKPTSAARSTKAWEFDKNRYIYYRVKFEQSGTSVTTPSALIFASGTARPQ